MIGDRWTVSQFEEYWQLVMDKLFSKVDLPIHTALDEVEQKHRLISTKNDPIYSTSCRFRIAVWSFAVQHSTFLFSLGTGVVMLVYLVLRYQQAQQEKRIVANLVEDVVHAIRAESNNFIINSELHPIPGLPVNNLKDHFLPSTLMIDNKEHDRDSEGRLLWYLPDDYTRSRIWGMVRKEVIKNSNIRETNSQVKGEAQMVWIWIGSHGLTPARKRRTDFGTIVTTESQNISQENQEKKE
jgi:hypothetical protein